MPMKKFIIVFIICTTILNSYVSATNYFVKSDATGANNGMDWLNAFTSLQAALAIAISGDNIYVASGIYHPSETEKNISFVITPGIKLYGGFFGNETSFEPGDLANRDFINNASVLSGDLNEDSGESFENTSDNSATVLSGSSLDVNTEINGFTISNTYYRGVDVGGSYFKLDNLHFSYNTLGLMIYTADYAEVINCSFVHNATSASIYNANPSFRNCTFANEKKGSFYTYYQHSKASYKSGGTVHMEKSNPEFINVLFAYNNKHYSENEDQFIGYSNPKFRNCILTDFDTALLVGRGESLGNNFSVPVFFKDIEHGDYRLYETSPGIGDGYALYGNNIGRYQGDGLPLPDNIYVKAGATGANNGTSWTDAYTRLQDAIDHSEYYQKICVAKGEYTPEGNIRDTSFAINNKTIWLYGGFAGDESQIDGATLADRDFYHNETILNGDYLHNDSASNNMKENAYHVLKIFYTDECTFIDGFTLKGGCAAYGSGEYSDIGSGIFIKQASPGLRNLKITGNKSNSGGKAISARDYSYVKLTNSTLTKNDYPTWDLYQTMIYTYNYSHMACINTIFYNNVPEFDVTEIGWQSSVVFSHSIVQYSGGSGNWQSSSSDGGHNQDTDPLFYNPEQSDVRLYLESPAIDSGNTTYGKNIGLYQGTGLVGPMLFVSDTSVTFDFTESGTESIPKTLKIAGTDLLSDLAIYCPSEFMVSLSENSGYITNDTLFVIPDSEGKIDTTTLYVKFAPSTRAAFNDKLNFVYDNRLIDLSLNGIGISGPVIYMDSKGSFCLGDKDPLIEMVTIEHADSPVDTVYAYSDNQSVVSNENISVEYFEEQDECNLEFNPNSGTTGIANIILVARDTNGLSDTATMEFTVKGDYEGYRTATICMGDSMLINGIYRKEPGNYTETYIGQTYCDSIVHIELSENVSYHSTLDVTICEGEFYYAQGKDQTTSGTYINTYSTVNGCDSIITVNLIVNSINTGVTVDDGKLVSMQNEASYAWFNCADDQPVGNARELTPPNVDDFYYLIIEYEQCIDTTVCFSLTPSSVNSKAHFHEKATIYPVPVESTLYIDMTNIPLRTNYKISNLYGQTVLTGILQDSPNTSVLVSTLEPGLYFIKISSCNTVYLNRMFMKK